MQGRHDLVFSKYVSNGNSPLVRSEVPVIMVAFPCGSYHVSFDRVPLTTYNRRVPLKIWALLV